MKQLRRLLTFTGLFVAALFLVVNMESCSSHRGIVSCPDVHHGNLAMHHVHFHNGNAVAHNHHKDAPQQAANIAPKENQPAPPASVTPGDGVVGGGGGLASASSDLKLKNPKEVFKLLTADEREQVKDATSKILAKHPMIKKMVLKKMERMDKRYPAPAQSSLRAGGSLSTGEILSIVAIACAVTWVLGIAALIIGIIALHMINRDGGANWAKILAIIAIVLGAIDLLTFILWLILVVIIASTI